MSNDGESCLMFSGKVFHNLDAATEKALSSYVFVVLVLGILRRNLLHERRCLMGTYSSNKLLR